jgi:acyl-coenzyme A synthetase/AMP-(fatty) acid ligase
MGLFTTADTRADELAAVIFTSGSTGIPKGVMYTHGNFASQIPMLRDTYNIQPGELSLQTFPLFALFDPGLGTATVVPDMDAAHPARVDPRKIIEPLEDFGITTMFGSPAVLDKLGRYGEEHRIRLPMLRRVISAGAPVPAEVLERFARMLPDEAEIFTPYGATEALPVASISSREVLGETRRRTDEGGGVCIGHPLKGAEVQVIRISDDPIPAWDASLALPVGEVGEIAVKGPMVTRSYFNRPRQTELAKIADPSGGFYHRMGDLACFDEAGRLWFCGRKSHRVETADGRLFTEPVEGVFNTHPDVRRSALVGVRIRGEIEPLVCIELEKNRPARSQEILREELLALGAKRPHTARISRFLFHPAFPVDIRHNSKIFRERLAAWAQKELGE